MAKYNLPNYASKDGLGFPKNFRRGEPNPLDNSSVWNDWTALENYAKTDGTAYVGQILSYIDLTDATQDEETGVWSGTTVKAYLIEDEQGTLKEVGSATAVPETDDLTISLKTADDGETQILTLKDFGTAYYKATTTEENGETKTTYSKVTGWKSGLELKVAEEDGKFVLAYYEPSQTTVEGVNSALASLSTTVDAHTSAIATLNGTAETEGSVAYQIAKIINGADESFDTLKEIADWINAHPENATEMFAQINTNKTNITTLQGLVGNKEVSVQIADELTKYVLKTTYNELVDRVAATEAKINTLNGNAETEGSVAKAIADSEGTTKTNYENAISAAKTELQTDYDAKLNNKATTTRVEEIAGLLSEHETTAETKFNDRYTKQETASEIASAITTAKEEIKAEYESAIDVVDKKFANYATNTELNNVSSQISTHAGNTDLHITTEERTAWNQNTTDIAELSELVDANEVNTISSAGGSIVVTPSGKAVNIDLVWGDFPTV